MMFFKQFSTARDTYKELLKSLDIAKVDANKKAKLQKETQQALKFFEKAPSVYNDPNVVMKVKPELPKLPDKNKKYPAMSNAVMFKYQPGRGKFLNRYQNRESSKPCHSISQVDLLLLKETSKLVNFYV